MPIPQNGETQDNQDVCNQDIRREDAHNHITNASFAIIDTSDELLKLAGSAYAK